MADTYRDRAYRQFRASVLHGFEDSDVLLPDPPMPPAMCAENARALDRDADDRAAQLARDVEGTDERFAPDGIDRAMCERERDERDGSRNVGVYDTHIIHAAPVRDAA